MANNKIILGEEVLMDLTGDTVNENNLLSGATAHNAAGEEISGNVDVVKSKYFKAPNGVSRYIKVTCRENFGNIHIDFVYPGTYFIGHTGNLVSTSKEQYGIQSWYRSSDGKTFWFRVSGYRPFSISVRGIQSSSDYITIADAITEAPSGITFSTVIENLVYDVDFNPYKNTVDRLDRESLALVPRGTIINNNDDLKDIKFLKVGKYFCSSNNTVATLKNCPTGNAFMMEVYAPLSIADIDKESTNAWIYRLRKITTYSGQEFVQACNSGATAGVFSFGGWRRTDLDTTYSFAEGTEDGTFKVTSSSGNTATIKVHGIDSGRQMTTEEVEALF